MYQEWVQLMEAAELTGLHFHTVRRLGRDGVLEARQVPWKGSATRFVWEFNRASLLKHKEWLDQHAPPDMALWMPIEGAQKALKMTRHGVKRRMKLGYLDFMHSGIKGHHSLYVSRKQVEEQVAERPTYARRTDYDVDSDEIEWAKLAGFFDGEGCVQISHARHGEQFWVLMIQITNTYRPKIVKIRNLFGGRVWNKSHQATTRKDCYIWNASGDEAQSILKRMRPYLDVKHEQADVAIEFQDRIRSRRWSRWEPLPPEEAAWREASRIRISELNHQSFPVTDAE